MGELHATFVDSKPGGGRALPLVALLVAQPLAVALLVGQAVALPVAVALAVADYRSRTWCLSSGFRLGLRAKVAVI